MNDVITLGRKTLSITVVVTTIAWAVGLSMLLMPLAVSGVVPAAPALVKGSLPAVYYYAEDGKRYVFPNQSTYMTWYSDFSGVTTITDTELAAIAIGGNVTVRPGVKMVKITTDPKVYAVAANGTLRHITTEAIAAALYGANWNTQILDIPDAFFTNYTVGTAINAAADYTPATATAAATTISVDKGISGAVVTGALTVAAASDNPAARNVIVSTAVGSEVANFLNVNLTAGTSAVTVSQLKFKREGISADSDLNNAYLKIDGKWYEMNSLSSGYLTFSNLALLIAANSSKAVQLHVYLTAAATAGKTMKFSLAAADVTATGSVVTVSGSAVGNTMTTTQVTDLGRLNIAAQANAATVDPGTTDFENMRFTLQALNQPVKVSKIMLTMIGSVDAADLTDFKLVDGATTLGTATSMATDKTLTFDLSASPLTILSGQTRTLRLLDKVVGGSTRTAQLSVQRRWHIEVTDTTYNVAIHPDTAATTFAIVNGTQTTVNAGNVIMSLDSGSPTGEITLNATDRLLAKYKIRANGESVRVSQLNVQLTSDAFGGVVNWTNLAQVRLVYDGTQVGTTQTSVAEDVSTAITTNFTIPVSTTDKYLEIRSNIAAAAGAANTVANSETIQARLVVGAANGQRTVSGGTVNVPTANINGNALIASSAALTAALNNTVGNPTLTIGSTGVRYGSYLLSAGAAEGVQVTTVTVVDRNAAGNANAAQSLGSAFNNLKLMIGGVQYGQTVTTNTADAAGTSYIFNLSPVLDLAASQQVQLDLIGDVISGAVWTAGERSRLVSAVGTSVVTNTTATAAAVNGQTITTATAGTLTTAVDASNPVAQQLAMGTTNVTLAVWRFSANTLEAINVSQIIANNAGSGDVTVNNLKLMVGGVQVGSTVAAFSGGAATFTASPQLFTVPAGGTALVSLVGNVTGFESGNTSGSTVIGRIIEPINGSITGVSTDTIIARGASGSFAATSVAAATNRNANTQYAYRGVFHVGLTSVGTPARGTAELFGRLSLNSTSVYPEFRGALQANDEADGGAAGNDWIVVGTTPTLAFNTTSTAIDGTNSVQWTEDGSAAVGDGLLFDFGASAALNTYDRIAFWFRSDTAVTAGDVNLVVNNTADMVSLTQNTSIGAVAVNTWTLLNIDLTGLGAADRYVGFQIAANAATYNASVLRLDNVRLFNDSIRLDLSGQFATTAPIGTELSLKQSGSTKAVGYYTGTGGASAVGTVTLFAGDDIGNAASSAPSGLSLSAGTVNYDVHANTQALMATDTTASEMLNLSIALGSATSAGGIGWNDNYAATAGTAPITWLLAVVNSVLQATPITISRAY